LKFLFPNAPDELELPLDRPRHHTLLFRNFLNRVAFHFPQRDVLQFVVIQDAKQASALLGYLDSKFGTRLAANRLGQRGILCRSVGRLQRSLIEHFAASPFLPSLKFGEGAGLSIGDEHEQLPQIVAVIELGKTAIFGGAAETFEGAQGDIFLISSTPRHASQLEASATDHQPEAHRYAHGQRTRLSALCA
jgi:hypothetical protein